MEEKSTLKPPSHLLADWTYFLSYTEKKKNCIPSCFDKENWIINNVYRMRVSQIYDLSKFWVVTKETELDLFHNYLHDFYSKYGQFYKLPPASFKLNTYCVVCAEGGYYRAVLLNVPLAIKKQLWIHTFLIDFGYVAKVEQNEVYFMTAKMYTVPQFAIRATLAGLGPVESSNWSSESVNSFNKLVVEKVLFGTVINIDKINGILYLILNEYNSNTQSLKSINDVIVADKVAKQFTIIDIKEMLQSEKTNMSKKTTLPFLLPSFSTIEKGLCPDLVLAQHALKEFICK